MRLRPLAIVLLTCASLVGVAVGPSQLGLPLAVLLVLILPGAGVAEALFAWRARFAEHVLVTVGLSLVLMILGGLLLSATIGITQHSVEGLLGGVAIAGAVIAMIAHRRTPTPTRSDRHLSIVEIVVFALSAALVAGAITYARKPFSARGVSGYSVLWVKPTAGRAEIGVKSQELNAMDYRVTVEVGSGQPRTWQLSLAPGGTWSSTVARKAGAGTLEAKLFRRKAGAWVVYRHVRAVA